MMYHFIEIISGKLVGVYRLLEEREPEPKYKGGKIRRITRGQYYILRKAGFDISNVSVHDSHEAMLLISLIQSVG